MKFRTLKEYDAEVTRLNSIINELNNTVTSKDNEINNLKIDVDWGKQDKDTYSKKIEYLNEKNSKTEKRYNNSIFVVFIVFIVVFLSSIFIIKFHNDYEKRTTAIKYGYGHFDSTTGKFIIIEPTK